MKTSQKLISAIFALALMAAPAAGQQPAKSGKYMGKLAGHLPGSVEQTYELEKGHVFVLGPFRGVFLNDVAEGFIDKTEVICPRALDVVDGRITAGHGYCIVTDKDGDKAFLAWEANDPTGEGGGNFKWIVGPTEASFPHHSLLHPRQTSCGWLWPMDLPLNEAPWHSADPPGRSCLSTRQ